MKATKIAAVIMMIIQTLTLQGQPTADSVFSLKDCIQLSCRNNQKIRQMQLETERSRYQLYEVMGAGLPQIQGVAAFEEYFDIPVNMVSGDILGQPGTMVPIRLGTKFTTNAGIQATQMIYDASYFATVRLGKQSVEISRLQLEQKKEELAYNLAQLYLSIQATNKQLALMDSNLIAYKKIYGYTDQHYRNGFILKSELDRILVVINNLETEQENLLLNRNQQLQILKYLMGLKADHRMMVSAEWVTLNLGGASKESDLCNQLEVRILEQNKRLAEMMIERAQAARLPSILSVAGYGYQSPVEHFGDFSDRNSWYPSSYIGIKLMLPLFEGNKIKNRVNQGEIGLQQVESAQKDLTNELSLKLSNELQKYSTNLAAEARQKRNMELAEAVYQITNQQYREGLRSLTDVLNARSEYNSAHRLWLNSVFQIKLSELETMKIKGTIQSLSI